MNPASRNQQFLTRLWMMHLATDFKFHLAFEHSHQFIRSVHEILPSLAWRISPQIAAEPRAAQSAAILSRFGSGILYFLAG
jgi:hypothetical protein